MKIDAGSLLDYLKVTLENLSDHAEEHPQLMCMAIRMDEIFQKEIFSQEFDARPAASLLAMNSYTLLLSAVQQALSGHIVAVFPVVRTALESACYAYLIAHNEDMENTWINRHISKSKLQECRNMFSVKKASDQLKEISSEMAEYLIACYDATIDFGAHPNQRSVFNHVKAIDKVDGRYRGLELTGVYCRNSWHVNYGLIVCTEIGQAIAFLLAASSKNHPLIHNRLEVFQAWLEEKNNMIDSFNGEPINYEGPMYSSVKSTQKKSLD